MARSRLTRTPSRDGLLLVDKPAGVTSHDVVLAARRAVGEPRIGHAGTLDPFATGLLVLLLGRATRLLPFMSGEPKVYAATIRFGTETETDDLHGAPTRHAAPPERAVIEAALPALTGTIAQVPPAYSAKRVAGRRAYDLARDGELPALAPVRITVHEWRILEWRAEELDVEITCGGGTYIRALARDLGRLTNSAAHLVKLRRLSSGPFTVADADTLDDVQAGRGRVRPPLDALHGMTMQPLAPADVTRVARGQEIPATIDGDRAALVTEDTGVLVAFAERRGEHWQPRVVMRPADSGAAGESGGDPDA